MRKTYVNFEKAQDYLELCNKASENFQKKGAIFETKETKTQYDVLETYKDSTNCKAILYRRGDEYIVSFFGTDIKSVKDIGTDVVMAVGKEPKQFKQAENFVRDMIFKYEISQDKLTAVGNSEGGAEAIHIKGVFGIKEVYTYNGYIPKLTQYPSDNLQDNNVYNFRTEGDMVSKAGYSIGEDFIVPVSDKCNPKWGPFGVVDWHRIENMGDCRDAQPAIIFESQNPNWKNKYGIGVLKSYEIEDIPKEMYPIFDEIINDRLHNNAVVNAPRPAETVAHGEGSGCAGTYQVSGYTRADGTEVASYFRTCGAHHIG